MTRIIVEWHGFTRGVTIEGRPRHGERITVDAPMLDALAGPTLPVANLHFELRRGHWVCAGCWLCDPRTMSKELAGGILFHIREEMRAVADRLVRTTLRRVRREERAHRQTRAELRRTPRRRKPRRRR